LYYKDQLHHTVNEGKIIKSKRKQKRIGYGKIIYVNPVLKQTSEITAHGTDQRFLKS